MRKVLIPAAALLAVAIAFSSSFAGDEKAKTAKVGEQAPEFSLQDQNGKTHKLSDYRGKVVVIEMFNQGCPYVVRHHKAKTMTSTAEKYKDKDVVWLAVNPTSGKTAEDNKTSAEAWDIDYPILNDTSTAVAQQYGAKTTPQMYIIDKEGKLVYNGAIDDDPSADGAKGDKAVNYVAKALDEVLAGKPVSTPETKPYGCGVKYKKADS
ncbi:MAG TPA: thioredoxin family protein [Tepidisphaeraceae bacterium]|nr:thioredoxin family protein [Tepidisphaeraceae bacterium]